MFLCINLFFYHTFMLTHSPQTRCKQAERARDLALEANRLFKQEFGDKIESLQVEVDHLRKHRYGVRLIKLNMTNKFNICVFEE